MRLRHLFALSFVFSAFLLLLSIRYVHSPFTTPAPFFIKEHHETNPKIIFGVLVSNTSENIQALLSTWGRHATIVVAADNVSMLSPLHGITAAVDLHEHGYLSMGRKAMKTWQFLCSYESSWYVMVDDDTFVIMKNLARIVKQFDAFRPYYLGYTLNHTSPALVGGGGGIVLSKAAHQKLCHASRLASACNSQHVAEMPGDLSTSYCMEDLDIVATYVDGFYPFPPQNMFASGSDNWCQSKWWTPKHMSCPPSEHAATFHYISPMKFHELYYWAYQFKRST